MPDLLTLTAMKAFALGDRSKNKKTSMEVVLVILLIIVFSIWYTLLKKKQYSKRYQSIISLVSVVILLAIIWISFPSAVKEDNIEKGIRNIHNKEVSKIALVPNIDHHKLIDSSYIISDAKQIAKITNYLNNLHISFKHELYESWGMDVKIYLNNKDSLSFLILETKPNGTFVNIGFFSLKNDSLGPYLEKLVHNNLTI